MSVNTQNNRSEVFPYVVILKSDNARYANLTGFFVSLISIFFFVLSYFIVPDRNIAWLIGAASVMSVIVWNIIQQRRNRKAWYKPGFILAAITWLSMPYLHWMAILLVAMYFLEHQAKKPQEIGFSEDRIVVNSLVNKVYYWQDLSNVILKDSLLTIDFHDNHFIQKEVLDDDDPDADEDEFNEFCRVQLARSR